MPEWCTGIPVLVHWAAMAMYRMASGGFAFALFLAFCFCGVYMTCISHLIYGIYTCMMIINLHEFLTCCINSGDCLLSGTI